MSIKTKELRLISDAFQCGLIGLRIDQEEKTLNWTNAGYAYELVDVKKIYEKYDTMLELME